MHWLHVLWFTYGWSSDKGNGPEAVQEMVIVGVATAIFVPVVRRWVKGEAAKIHQKLDHVIKHHPTIPTMPPEKEKS